MKKAGILFAVLFILPVVSGCVPLIVGGAVGAGAVGGYAISKDTIQGETDKRYEALWNSALMVSRIKGTIKQEDAVKGFLELESDGNRVWVRLVRLTRSATRLKISARNKLHLPNIGLAQEMYVKIIEEAR